MPSTSRSSGPPTPSTAAAPPRSATWPGTSSPSASTTADAGRAPSGVEVRAPASLETRPPRSPATPTCPPTRSPTSTTRTHRTRRCAGGSSRPANRLLSVDQIRAWCGRPDVQVVVTQVIDLRERLECQGYKPTPKIREHVIVRDGTCVFPWCGRNARRCDLDHVIPYDHDHPEQGGPTATDNLAPLCRRHHRLKTRGRWRYEMTEPGRVRLDQPARQHLPPRPHRQPARSAAPGPTPGRHADLRRTPAGPLTTTPRTPPQRHRRGHRHVQGPLRCWRAAPSVHSGTETPPVDTGARHAPFGIAQPTSSDVGGAHYSAPSCARPRLGTSAGRTADVEPHDSVVGASDLAPRAPQPGLRCLPGWPGTMVRTHIAHCSRAGGRGEPAWSATGRRSTSRAPASRR